MSLAPAISSRRVSRPGVFPRLKTCLSNTTYWLPCARFTAKPNTVPLARAFLGESPTCLVTRAYVFARWRGIACHSCLRFCAIARHTMSLALPFSTEHATWDVTFPDFGFGSP